MPDKVQAQQAFQVWWNAQPEQNKLWVVYDSLWVEAWTQAQAQQRLADSRRVMELAQQWKGAGAVLTVLRQLEELAESIRRGEEGKG